MGSHRHFLDDPFFPFPPPPQPSSCPFLDFDSTSPFPDLDLFLPPSDPSPSPFLLRVLTDRVAALELAVAARRPEPTTRKCTYVTEAGGRKVKWTSVQRPRAGDRTLKWEAKGASAAAPRKLKWGAAVKGKGSLEPWSQAYTWEEDLTDDDDDDEEKADSNKTKVADKKKKNKNKAVNKEKKCPVATVKIEEISDDNDAAGCVAIRKAFAKGNGRGKRKELSPQDAALLIQMTYRAHLAHRSQVLRCLRDLAVAKAKLKEIRSLFYNISYRRRLANDQEERQRFSEKVIVLLITVDALEGPDYMVRVAKKSMLEELEAMLEVVDPQPPGKQRSLNRRKFDLPEAGAVSVEKTAGVNKAVRIIQEGK
ncbi:BAG family molecular chaperone regulator 7-like isoform X2 [Panicum virgatum]|uniref:BAG family molecular chaperone regulator 7-like isoform X2 n=1 Tax=Panicum virgatum TaxID=38727 RepID=UPI0019D57103|nr:BAG family molecular chaperone regulator 7-like isoform X2 [Panicum virgatum]